MEQCIGCEREASAHPFVAVVSRDFWYKTAPEVRPVFDDARFRFVAFAVCERCWRDPASRPARKIKGAFFPRLAAAFACEKAGSSTIGG